MASESAEKADLLSGETLAKEAVSPEQTSTTTVTTTTSTDQPQPPISSSQQQQQALKVEDIQTLLSSWRLTPTRRQEIFSSQILPTELAPFLSPSSSSLSSSQPCSEKPQAIILLGQTGAGKTSLAPLLLQHFDSSSSSSSSSSPAGGGGGPPLHFIADTLKTYHPHFSTCPPPYASALASADARHWLKLSCAHAAAHSKSVLLESACRHPDDFISLVKIFKEHSYAVKVVVLAVSSGVSRLGCLTRFYRRLPESGSKWGLGVRKTPKRVHDESCEGVVEGVKFVDENLGAAAAAAGATGVDKVVVLRRNKKVAYMATAKKQREYELAVKGNNSAGDDGGRKKGKAQEALNRERKRALTEDEWSTVKADLQLLKEMGEVELEEIEKQIRGLGGGGGGGGEEEEWPELEEEFDAEKFVKDV
ncbi:zeta toxin-domain-containing protein [Cladorrhinum sp. PSN259]|nr:zeta toxin-domain-containing protein [Cladorrhinum sp. PSN259]